MCFFKAPSQPAYQQPIQYQQQPTVIREDAPPKAEPAPTAANATTAATNTVTNNTTQVVDKQAPQEQDRDVSDMKKAERKRIAARNAENSTIATGGAGLLPNSAQTGTKQLLGA